MTKKTTTPGTSSWPLTERRKSGWAADWQSTVERDKAAMADSLHDDTGGLLIAAMMDITWAENHLPAAATVVKERLNRARAALDVAIGLNRRMIEDLRPTLLDNFGLITALQWYFAEACKSADITCEHELPQQGPNFKPAAAIALYRTAQTLVAVMVSHQARALGMALFVDSEFVTFQMNCDGMPDSFTRDEETLVDALASVTGRIRALGGTMTFEQRHQGALISCRMPAATALCPKALV